MNYNTIEKYFSLPRIQKYLNHFSGDKNKAFRLYRANLRLSEAFYPLLSILEISLRNSIDNYFSSHFSDPSWLYTQSLSAGFMSDTSLNVQPGPFYLKNNVNRAIRKLGTSYSHGKLISELTFGFWTQFFDRIHYRVLRGQSIHIFPNLPPNVKRNNIYAKLNSIRFFRNRVYHYEPICFDNGTISIINTQKVYNEILEIYSWFDDDLVKWSSFIDFVPYEFAYINNCASKSPVKQLIFSVKLKSLFVITKVIRSLKSDKII